MVETTRIARLFATFSEMTKVGISLGSSTPE
jgi:hypothetical protein